MHRGSCLCGAITYRVSAALGAVTACHCGQCRKITGHHSAAVPAPWDAIEIEGPLKWYESSARARRGFCPDCGSCLFWEEYDGLAYISAGTLDGETGLKMDGHIFYGDKGDYYVAGDALPCWTMGRSSSRLDGGAV